MAVTYPRTIKVGIYTATRNDTGRVVYVGQAGSLRGCEGRWREHERAQGKLGNIIRKHGVTWNIVWETKRTFTSGEEQRAFENGALSAWERWVIRSYDTKCVDAQGKTIKGHPGCNLNAGGNGGQSGRPDISAKGGRISGHITGPITGRWAVESGHLASITTPETCAKGGRIGGRKNVESGQFASMLAINLPLLASRAGAVTRAKGCHFRTLEERAAHWGFASVADYIAARDARNAYRLAREKGAPADQLAALKAAMKAAQVKQDHQAKKRNMLANKVATDAIVAAMATAA